MMEPITTDENDATDQMDIDASPAVPDLCADRKKSD